VGLIGPRRTRDDRGGTFWLTLIDAQGCVSPTDRSRFAPVLCGVAEAGWLAGRGTGVAHPRTSTSEWFAFGGKLGTGLALGRTPWRLEAGVSVLGVPTRAPFVLDSEETVHRPAAAVGRVEFGFSRGLE
jgi:hypothetical protein